jgi:hypothetical protein
VLLAFIGPPPSPQHQAGHHDGDRENNNVWNLSWLTPAENGKDRRRHNQTWATIRAYAVARAKRSSRRIKVPGRFLGRCVGRLGADRYIDRVCN